MKRWIVILLLVAALSALALSAGWWLPALLAFAGANTDLIQGVEALTQLVLWLAAGGVFVWGACAAGGLPRWLRNIQRTDPNILGVALATIANPLVGFGMVARKAAERMKQRRDEGKQQNVPKVIFA